MQFHKQRISPQQWPEGPFYWLFFFGVVFEVSQVVLAGGLGWVDLGGLFRGDPHETWDYHLRKLYNMTGVSLENVPGNTFSNHQQ